MAALVSRPPGRYQVVRPVNRARIANVATWTKGPDAQAVWDVDDESFLKAAEEHLRSSSRGAGTSDKVKKAG